MIFDTAGRAFYYSDHYIELGTSLPTNNIFGLGESNNNFVV